MLINRVQTITLGIIAVGLLGLGIGGGYWLALPPPGQQSPITASAQPVPKPLYYQGPDGKPEYSATPKKTVDGRPFKPIYAPGAQPASTEAHPPQTQGRRILYYKNPMGLPDTSPVPRKDSMGMDYVPVYAGEAGNVPGIVTVSPARVQMLGVRTAPAQLRTSLGREVQATGSIEPDESRLSSVTTKFDGVVQKLFVATTGAHVTAGQPLAQVWIQTPDTAMQAGPDVITRQIDLVIALQDKNQTEIAQAENVLRQYGIPHSAIDEIVRTGQPTRFVTITAPRSGVILQKPAIEGMHFNTGDPLFEIADFSSVWLITDVQEQDLGAVKVGDTATASFVAYPGRSFKGKVAFIYPTLVAGTRQGQARIILPNADGLLRESMYANVMIDTPTRSPRKMVVVPDSAILDNGTIKVVLVAHGQGRFEPRMVETGLHGDGYTEILKGVRSGEQVVVDANFLIDAESNLEAALQAFTQGQGNPTGASRP
ncbi:MAG: efflux RND transporter periplasmic adaptor subunit [Rhizomicrobium sp.]